MKRIRVLCGICRGTKYYSINRGITKVSSIIACENCRHFYQKLKRSPFSLDCISPIKGSCYKDCSFMKTRCKGCWAMQLLDSCPHPSSFYTLLCGWISEDCRKQMRGTPMKAEELMEDAFGNVSIEVYENDEWKEVSSPEDDLSELPVTHEDQVNDPPPPPFTSRRTSRTTSQEEEEKKQEDVEVEEERFGKSKASTANSKNGEDPMSSLSVADLVLEPEEEMIDLEEEEAMVDDPGPPPTTARLAKMSERIKRKRKKVEYFTKPITGRKTKGPIYGSDGKINKTGMDLCDCLQSECVGCHFPCPKCRSPKCGNECRVNRRWYYEKVEVEGTKLFWVNRFVPKL